MLPTCHVTAGCAWCCLELALTLLLTTTKDRKADMNFLRPPGKKPLEKTNVFERKTNNIFHVAYLPRYIPVCVVLP